MLDKEGEQMTIRINDTAPDFTASTTEGKINFHEWIGEGWAMLFSHPKDFTPVCATELGNVAQLNSEFAKRGCKVMGLSVDRVEDHQRWAADIEDISGTKLNFPIIAVLVIPDVEGGRSQLASRERCVFQSPWSGAGRNISPGNGYTRL